MALKFKITKKAYEALSDDLKAEYKADGDEHFQLDVSGIDTADSLRRAKERVEIERDELKEENATLQEAHDALETQVADANKNKSKETKDMERDLKKLQTKYDRDLATKDEENAALRKSVEKTLVDSQADKLAAEISTSPKLMAREIKDRMETDYSDGEPKIVFKGKDGKADPKLTLDDVKKDLLANPDLKSILIGNKASGSAGQKPALPVTGATRTTQNDENTDVNTLGNSEYVERVRASRIAAGKETAPAA